jgi:hypothetical protein
MPRPEWVSCVAKTRKDETGISWCGRDVANEWHFTGLDHLANSRGDRIMACPNCTARAFVAMIEQTWDEKGKVTGR